MSQHGRPRGKGQGLDASEMRRFEAGLGSLPRRQGGSLLVLRWVVRGWCRLVGWRMETTTAPLPLRQGVAGAGSIVASAPHRSWVEPFLLLAAWPSDAARLVWLADGRTVTRSWWRRRLLPRLGVIPVAGEAGGPRGYAEQAAMVLAAGHAVAVFPEVGGPSQPDEPRRISPGFAYLALRSGAPVVPVLVGGTHHIVRGSSFSVDILETIKPDAQVPDPFTPEGRELAHALAAHYASVIRASLPARTAWSDARAPRRDRWSWLGRLFR